MFWIKVSVFFFYSNKNRISLPFTWCDFHFGIFIFPEVREKKLLPLSWFWVFLIIIITSGSLKQRFSWSQTKMAVIFGFLTPKSMRISAMLWITIFWTGLMSHGNCQWKYWFRIVSYINSNIFRSRVTPVNIIGFSQNLVGFVFGLHRTNSGGGT